MFPKRFLWNFTFSPFQENYFWDPPHLKCHSSRKSINLIMWWVFQNSKFMYCKKRMMLVFNMIFVLLCAAIQSNQIIYQGNMNSHLWGFMVELPIYWMYWMSPTFQSNLSIHPSMAGSLEEIYLWWMIWACDGLFP